MSSAGEHVAALRYAAERLWGVARCRARAAHPPDGIVMDADVAVAMRDGVALRANVYRPQDGERHPVIMSAHPYGKDRLPRARRGGYRVSAQFRLLRQTGPIRFSALTTWEAPDPAWWVARGYAVVNADLRGCGTSDGTGTLLSRSEGEDYHDLIEWAGAQPWSTGRVGLAGVSYLAMTQYRAAAERPPSLAAICPWEGLTDTYRDLARPGGIRENGFLPMWARGVGTQNIHGDLRREQLARPLYDEWWRARTPDLERIEVPMLVCASFSDNCLHSRGSFRAFQRVGSRHRYAYTHRGGKWATFYSAPALAAQHAFFERFVRGDASAMPDRPPVRVEVRSDRTTVHAVRDEDDWPIPRTRWTALHLAAAGSALHATPVAPASHVEFDTRDSRATFSWPVPEDVELTGPMALRLHVEARDCLDLNLFVGVEKWRGGRFVPFEGSYGFGRDRVATGWLRASLRALDPERSSPWAPEHTFARPEPLAPGAIVPVDIALGPSATLFRAGEELRLVVACRWLSPTNPITGQLPARYSPSPRGTCILHTGGRFDARLLVPVIPPASE